MILLGWNSLRCGQPALLLRSRLRFFLKIVCGPLLMLSLALSFNSSSAAPAAETNVPPSAPAAQQSSSNAVSSLPAQGQTGATEPVTPFYEKASASASGNSAPKIGSGSHLLSVTLGLIAIIALIFALSFFVKRFGPGTFSANTQLKIISSMPLGTRERIVLIDAAGQQLLLGITPTNINTLHVFAEPIVMENKPENSSDFSKKLMAILQQKTTSSAPDSKNNSAAQE